MLETTEEERKDWEPSPTSFPEETDFTSRLCRDVDMLVKALGAYYAAWSPSNGQRGWKIDPQGMRRAHEKARAVLGEDS